MMEHLRQIFCLFVFVFVLFKKIKKKKLEREREDEGDGTLNKFNRHVISSGMKKY
jgi:hypothetical protein